MAESETSLLNADNSEQVTQETWYGDQYGELVKTKGWDTPDKFLESYVNLEKGMGQRVKMPTPESSAEEIRAFYQKTGCPENPDGYEVQVPEGLPETHRNEDVENSLKQIAYEQGVSKQAFESIVKGYYEKMQADLAASAVAGEKQLKEEFADKYDENIAIAQRFCATCSDEFKELLETTGLGNHPIFVKEFYEKGKQTLNDTIIKGDGGTPPKDDFVPANIKSPEMYATGEDDYSKKARQWFRVNKDFKYARDD